MEKTEMVKIVNELRASINRAHLLYSVVAKTEHKEATMAYLEQKEQAENLLDELGRED